jgi:hypothetical protein
MNESISFIGTLPTGRTAVAFTGDGDSKISLDTDAEQITAVLAVLLKMRGKTLKVTVEVVD